MKKLAAFVPLLGFVVAGCPNAPPSSPAPPVRPAVTATATKEPDGGAGKRAPVVVAMVVDQFAAWIAEERLAELPRDGGFARLAREGTWVRKLRYPYAITDTAPGHAALHTGAVPAESGITTNEIPDEKTGKRSSVFIDPETKLLTPAGPAARPGSSAKRLKVGTVADRLRAARPDATILSVSLKDRGALLPAGRRPNHALWFDAREGSFVTSSAVAASFPSWAAPIADRAAIARAMASPWQATDVEWLGRVAGKDDAPGEGDLDGLGVTFPHTIKTPTAFRGTPNSDAVLLELALAGATAERRADAPLLLLVSLSANDVIGHVFGPSSWEAWDQLRKLDAALAHFFDALEAAVGPFGVILSGDHGGVAMPEARAPLPASCRGQTASADPYDRPACIAGSRLEPDALRTELRAESAKVLGRPDLVSGIADGCVFFSREAIALDPEKRAALDRVVQRVLLDKHGKEVEAVFDVRDLAKRCPGVLVSARGVPQRALPGEELIALVCRSWADVPDSGDYVIVPKRGHFFDGEVVPGKGSSHGTPYLYDRTVPLFVRTATRGADDGRVIEEAVDFTAYAALEAALLGLDSISPRAILDARTAR